MIAEKAAIKVGYAPKSAKVVASRILKKEEVKKLIEEKTKKASEKAEINAVEFIEFVKKVAHRAYEGYPVYDKYGNVSHRRMDSTALIGSLNIIAKYAGFDKVKVEHETTNGFGIVLNLNGKPDKNG